MKKRMNLLIALVASVTVFANVQGHFFLNVENENVQVSQVDNKLPQWLNLPANADFSLFRDETDYLGIRHLSYQQSVDGTEVLHAMVTVHAKNDVVFAINGDIMDATVAAQLPSRRISPIKAAEQVRKNAKASDAQLKIVRAYVDGKMAFRYAYEVTTGDLSEKRYIDAETGRKIKDVPLHYNADVAGTATTMYNGKQAIICYENEGKYYLMDQGRGIITLDATNNTYSINYERIEKCETLEEQSTILSEELDKLIDGASTIYNTSSTWTSSWNTQLKSVTINAIVQNDTWHSVGEGAADVYLKILDQNNNVIYTSGYYDDPTFPVTFNISSTLNLTSPPYYVQLWDYDPIGGDDIIDIFTIETIFGGYNVSYSWIGGGKCSYGSYSIEFQGKQPLLDAHWGMEKTLDFYREKFNRNSFDDNGTVVYQLVNQPADKMLFAALPLNAFAVNIYPFPMVYGMGMVSSVDTLKQKSMKPLVSIDIMAHEFSHLVINQNGNGGLTYFGESGALNESFADIMGISVKNYATGKNDWLIGSGVLVNMPCMRSMKNPKDGLTPQPDTYNAGMNWADVTDNSDKGDNGGVHTNSGVQNYWYYLLSEGGNGTNDINNTYNVKGIGLDKAIQIAYRNLIYYLTPEATHEDARNGSIQAAIDLFGKDSQEYQSVVNAWYAVGVGSAYASGGDITISAKMPSNWGTTIAAWTWANGSEGKWASLEKHGEWYSYTTTASPLNIVFVNGTTWNGDNNQSVDISITESACIQLANNTSGKRNYTVIECEEEQVPETDNYVVLAQRNASSNWFYMTSDLGTASTKRYQAVDAGTSMLADVITSNLDSKYYWQMEENKLHTAAGYSTWTSGNSANFNNTGKELTIVQQADGTYTFSFADGEDTRYLALNKTDGNNYFAYYKGTGQIYKLTLIKEGEHGIATAIEDTPIKPATQKIIRNGQLLILRDGKTYTIQGLEVK